MMQCPICRTAEPNWENVDKFRIKPEGMAICLDCGFISYPEKYRTKEEIIEYYKNDYRPPPTVQNLFSGQRKLHYHAAFLEKTFDEFKKRKLEKPVVADVGAAFGMFLDWVRQFFPKAELHGVELTKSFVRNAYHLYKIEMKDFIDTNIKYDLICSYKTLEHVLDPDVELTSYIDSLNEGGFLYLSVPIWFRRLGLFGEGGWNIESYYHPNHINVWNLEQFEALIAICGGEILRQDHKLYESTYLIKRGSKKNREDVPEHKQDIDKIKHSLNRIFTANEAFEMGKHKEALDIWPNFPLAVTANFENNRNLFHAEGFDKFWPEYFEQYLEVTKNDPELLGFSAEVCMRYNRFEMAIKLLDLANQLRPHNPTVYVALSNCFRSLAKIEKDKKLKVQYIEESRKAQKILQKTSMQNFADSMTNIMIDNANLPTPFE